MLKSGKAKVARMVPFTIQLLYGSSGYKQEVSLGVDAGTRQIGVCATTERTVLFEAEVKPRTDIQEGLATRQHFRRARRNRKTRYRKARFLNRRKPEGWLAPSVQHKVDAHLKTIRLCHKLLPVSKTTIEVAQFDLQKIKYPEIAGVEYQQGPQLGFWNVREYVLFRDGYSCQWCKGKSKDPILNVHHIESRKTGGDSPDNLITLCETCHDLLHRTHQEGQIERTSRGFRDATQMGVIRWRIYDQAKALFPQVHLTYGYITKHTRIAHELEKSHRIDARCISGNSVAQTDGEWYMIKWVRRNNRQLHKATIRKGGKRQRNTAPFLLELSAQELPPMRLLKAYRKLHLYAPRDLGYLLACKLMLGRLEKDGADIAVLRQVLAIQNRSQAQQIVDRYFPSPAQQATYRLPCTLGRMFEK